MARHWENGTGLVVCDTDEVAVYVWDGTIWILSTDTRLIEVQEVVE